MILALIVLTLATVYYISYLANLIVEPQRHAPKRGTTGPKAVPAAGAVMTPGLVALGRALDQYGRGQEPLPLVSGAGEEVRKTQVDRL